MLRNAGAAEVHEGRAGRDRRPEKTGDRTGREVPEGLRCGEGPERGSSECDGCVFGDGRVFLGTGMRRPDNATPSARSGVDVAYGPNVEFRTDVAGAGGGAVRE